MKRVSFSAVRSAQCAAAICAVVHAFDISPSAAENPARTKAVSSISAALKIAQPLQTSADLAPAVLAQRIAAAKPAIALGRAHFAGKRLSDYPADIADEESAHNQWYRELESYNTLVKRLNRYEAASAWMTTKAQLAKLDTDDQFNMALGNFNRFCNEFRNSSDSASLFNSECQDTQLLTATEQRVKSAVAKRGAAAFNDGLSIPAVKLDITKGHAMVSTDVTAAGLRIEVATGGVTDVSLSLIHTEETLPQGAVFVNCMPEDGTRYQTFAECPMVATEVAHLTLANGDSIWLRGALKKTTLSMTRVGYRPTAAEMISGAPPANSPPSMRNLRHYGESNPMGAHDFSFAESLFTQPNNTFVVFIKAATACTQETGGAELKLQANEAVIIDFDDSGPNDFNEPGVLRTDGTRCVLKLDDSRIDFYRKRKVKPADDIFSTVASGKAMVATFIPNSTKNVDYSNLDTDMQYNPLAGITDKRVTAYNKFRAPIAACVLKDLNASGDGSGLRVATSDARTGAVKKVQSLNSLFRDRAYKKCRAQALYVKTAELSNVLRREALARIAKALNP